MKTQFPKKSEYHEEHIRGISDHILEHFGDDIAYIILFGSFARGTRVSSIHTGYFSDYDILVVTKLGRGALCDEFANDLEIKIGDLLEDYPRLFKFRWHDPSVIVESPEKVNDHLEKGKYFFSDIEEQGILLYDSGEFELSEKRDLNVEEMIEVIEEDYHHWFEKGNEFTIDAKNAFKRGSLTNSAFYLHQAAESFLYCSLLVLTAYKPFSHSIRTLTSLCANQSGIFAKVFPRRYKDQRQSLDKLEKAYVHGRYSKEYTIEEDQVKYLIKRVKILKHYTKITYKRRIKELGKLK